MRDDLVETDRNFRFSAGMGFLPFSLLRAVSSSAQFIVFFFLCLLCRVHKLAGGISRMASGDQNSPNPPISGFCHGRWKTDAIPN